MQKENKFVTRDFIDLQYSYMDKVKSYNLENKKAVVETFGCQQNVADSQIIQGMLIKMGYEIISERENADLIIFNTCAVRENAENRVFGNLGSLKKLKKENPSLLIGVCGCMVQQEHIAQEIKNKFKHVDFVFGTHALYNFPKILFDVISENQHVFDISDSEGKIAEGLPIRREFDIKAFVSIMYGCNNFCTYCIVPYVRGRERSRKHEDVLQEVKGLIKDGVKEITLLGQNVNSYGKDLYDDYDFSDLIKEIDEIEGEFLIKFMTSHPKDCSKKLIDTIASSKHISHHLHLPFQSGSNSVLKAMNRRYTVEDYKALINYAKEKIPDSVITSDVIVGFPGETEEDFNKTIELIQSFDFDTLFMFVFSIRKGTPAEKMENQVPKEIKDRRIQHLVEVHHQCSSEINAKMVGHTLRVLIEEEKEEENTLIGHSTNGKLVIIPYEKGYFGKFVDVKITKSKMFSLEGNII